MPDLTTCYLGLPLKNPLIVASCSLTSSLDGVQKCEAAGAGAVVLKSLFEEQLLANGRAALPEMEAGWHPEAVEYVENLQQTFSTEQYLDFVRATARLLKIPVIASLNCITPGAWTDIAKKLEDAGASALELNVAFMPVDPKWTSDDVQNRYYDILGAVKSSVQIPVAIKLGPYFTSLAHTARQLQWHGADGLVLFNRFYRFDIDTENISTVSGNPYSTSDETTVPLRWISLLSHELDLDLAASTGIHTGTDAVKHLLAGATVVQLCSTLYLNGIEHIQSIRTELESWMERHRFASVGEFRGRLQRRPGQNLELAERLQYIKALVGLE